MTSILETMIAGALARGLAAGGAATSIESDGPTDANANTIAEQLASPEFLTGIGISQPVYECAQQVLEGETADDLEALIRSSATVGTTAETPTQAALRQCVEQDPFGWAGTDQEWAIPLVTKYMKEGN